MQPMLRMASGKIFCSRFENRRWDHKQIQIVIVSQVASVEFIANFKLQLQVNYNTTISEAKINLDRDKLHDLPQ